MPNPDDYRRAHADADDDRSLVSEALHTDLRDCVRAVRELTTEMRLLTQRIDIDAEQNRLVRQIVTGGEKPSESLVAIVSGLQKDVAVGKWLVAGIGTAVLGLVAKALWAATVVAAAAK